MSTRGCWWGLLLAALLWTLLAALLALLAAFLRPALVFWLLLLWSG